MTDFDPDKERRFAWRHALPPAIIAVCLAVAAACCGCATDPYYMDQPAATVLWTTPTTSEAEALMRSAWEEWRIIVAMIGAGEYDEAWQRGRVLLARWGEILARPGVSVAPAVPSSASGVPAGTGASWGQASTEPPPTPLSADARGVIERGEDQLEELDDATQKE